MIIPIDKFGTTLTSRQAGREAFAAFLPSLKEVGPEETVVVDFDGVITFSPSWGDEFLKPLVDMFGDRLLLKKTDNPSVLATLPILEQVHGRQFRLKNE